MSLETISNKAISDDALFEASRYALPGFTPMIVSGEGFQIAQAVETVWPEGGIYVFPPAATIMNISCANVNDTVLGTGIRRIFIFGLDADYRAIFEVIETNGLTGVPTTKEYLRINLIYGVECGSNETNHDSIYLGTGTITAGKPAVVYSMITDGVLNYINRSIQGVITVPKGYRCYIIGAVAGVGAGKDFKTSFIVRIPGGCWNSSGILPVFENSINIPFRVYPSLPETADMMIMGRENGSTGVDVSTSLSLLFERKDNTEKFIIPNSFRTSDVWEF